ncbi:hypothetical protein BDA99DRAFT_536316 [Phascolomyces articulosus]|uniref:PH domain-containing protein n=1 Tax=Phascolomyces articulosus TaxID=60185 RepID=A0AAD5K3B2_9FUNG|nr:hypothetical protein BDA99DRAFT_536316 [Phascolomyces articulosus]
MKDALIKAGVQHVIASTPKPKAPGSDLEALPQQQKKRYFWQKKEDPHYLLTPHEKKILHKVKSRARTLDSGLSCCCCHVGLDPIIGLIPVIGDFAGLVLSLYLVQTAAQVHLPQSVMSQMMMNVIIDFLLGIVPILGDIMDVFYKCNTRNAILLENYLNKQQLKRQQEEGAGDGGSLSSPHTQQHLQQQPLLQNSFDALSSSSSSSSQTHHLQKQPQPIELKEQKKSLPKNPHHY